MRVHVRSGLVSQAGAVVFEGAHLTSADQARRRPGQLWVAYSIESTASIRSLADPAVMAGFDLTMT